VAEDSKGIAKGEGVMKTFDRFLDVLLNIGCTGCIIAVPFQSNRLDAIYYLGCAILLRVLPIGERKS
jgi:hypothetical protein